MLNRVEKCFQFKQPLVWLNVVSIFTLFVSIPLMLIFYISELDRRLALFNFFYGYLSGIGVTMGAHRLWAHRTYKAKLPLRIALMCCYMMAGQYSLVQWCRDHRLHHKYSDTDADPHNANRGFFFCHCGWLMMKRHPEVKSKGKGIDLSDLWADPVVAFQQKYFKILFILFFIAIPITIPMILWEQTLLLSLLVLMFRYFAQLNLTWTVNSVTHYFGDKPFDKSIRPVENKFISFVTLGEGWHNYHHIFPYDYRMAHRDSRPNFSAYLIDTCAKFGLAYDLKTTPDYIIEKVKIKNSK